MSGKVRRGVTPQLALTADVGDRCPVADHEVLWKRP